MQEDLVGLGFLAEADRGNSDAVAEATVSLLGEGAELIKNLNVLLSSLGEAKRRFDAVDDGRALRDASLHALDSVIQFLMLFPRVHAEGLVTPLARLFGDLKSLDDGAIHPMVEPMTKIGRAPAGGFYDHLKGIAVFVVRRLEASDMSLPRAREAVAKELNKLEVRPARSGSREGSGRFTSRTIFQVDGGRQCRHRAENSRRPRI